MFCRVTDLRYKDVVSVSTGERIGYVADVEVNTANAQILAIVIYGRYRCFGLLGREDDVIVPWSKIQIIGEDTILVNFCCDNQSRCKKGIFGLFGN